MALSSEHDVLALDELPEGEMRQVELDGTQVLLVREGSAVHAVSATCPHAGGPLLQGVRHGHRIVCPWHKAAFCLRTGVMLDPPALDPLLHYDTRIEGGRVKLAMPGPVAPARPAADSRCFVIIGAGAAGAVAAQTLREIGFAGQIIMLDRANRVPYDRTVLSKYHLSGETGGEKTPLQRQSYWREHGIERRTAEVVQVDALARRITCADGTMLPYDAALLATGGEPQRPDLPGAGLDHVFVLRSRADADAILARAERSSRAVVLGASFIGMEVAAALRERGLDVSVLAKQETPFARQLGTRIGTALLALHERRGVHFYLGREVASIAGDAVRLTDGRAVAADLVVIGFGIRLALPALVGVERTEDGGVPVDASLRAADGLWAAGDIAAFPLYGIGPRIRLEHWRVAEQHGRVAALNMAGQPACYNAVPVFWTIQYLKRLDYVGHAANWDDVVVHGDPAKPEFLAYYVKDGRVVAAAGLDRDRDTAALVELMTRRRDWTPEELGARPALIGSTA